MFAVQQRVIDCCSDIFMITLKPCRQDRGDQQKCVCGGGGIDLSANATLSEWPMAKKKQGQWRPSKRKWSAVDRLIYLCAQTVKVFCAIVGYSNQWLFFGFLFCFGGFSPPPPRLCVYVCLYPLLVMERIAASGAPTKQDKDRWRHGTALLRRTSLRRFLSQ